MHFIKIFRGISISICCALLLPFLSASVQAENKQRRSPEAYSLASPYDAVLTHLGNLAPGNEKPQIAAYVFKIKPPTISNAKAIKIARKLKEVFDKRNLYINIEEISNEPNYIDPDVKYNRYQISKKLPEVYLVKLEDKWLYSQETIAYVIKLLQNDKKTIKYYFPKDIRQSTLFGIPSWQCITLCILFIGLFFLSIIATLLLRIIAKNVLGAWEGPIHTFNRLLRTSLNCFVLKITLPLIEFPLWLEKWIARGLDGILMFTLTLLVYRLIDVLLFYIKRMLLTHEQASTVVHLLPLYQKSLQVIVIILGGVMFLDSLGYPTSNLITGISLGGLGFALASQDTIRNLFGSLMIIIDKPFRVGDDIISGVISGKVQEIGFRSTRLRTIQGSIMYIPNGKLADTHIDNLSLRKKRRFSTEIPIKYNTPSYLITSFVEGLEKIAASHSLISPEKIFIYLNSVEESHVGILFAVSFRVNSKEKELQCKHEVISDIMKLSEDLKIDLGAENKPWELKK